MMDRTLLFTAAALGLTLLVAMPSPGTSQVEVEVDPIAYAASGFSLHVAKVLGPARLNVGTFGAEIPTWLHGNEGWTSTMRGAGVKLDYVGQTSDGWFVGLEGGYLRMEYRLAGVGEGAGEAVGRDVVGVGLRGGYRLPLGGRGLYIAPWVGLGYNFDGSAVVVGDEVFERSAVVIFPTVHIGWRF
jgi:hypothetical protein